MRMALFLLVPLLLLGVGAVPAADSQDEGGPVPNSYCPVTSDEPVDRDIYAEYEGKTVFFCCKRCRNKFLSEPSAYLAALPQFATQAQEEHVHAESSHDHGSHGAEEKEHDHARDQGLDEQGSRGAARALRYLGRLHPLVVHFPIALLLTAGLAECLYVRRKRIFWRDAARYLLLLGSVSAVAAASLGWVAALGATYSGDLAQVLFRHRWIGVATALLSVVAWMLASSLNRRPHWEKAYRVALAVTALLVALAGHFGASLIYGTDYFSW